jgi:hypothetical protein
VLAVAERTDADELPLVAAQDALVHPRRLGAESVG